MRHFCVLTIALLFFSPSLFAQRVEDRPANPKPFGEVIVYPVQSGSAIDLAESLQHLYQNHQISVQAEQNLLMIRVDADTKSEILNLLKQVDRPARAIEVHAYLLRSHGAPLTPAQTAGLSGTRAEVLRHIASLQNSDQLSIENRIELATTENQKAMVQVGQQVAIVAGFSSSSSRGRVTNYQRLETGMIFSVVARTTPQDELVLEINFEKSDVEPAVAASDEADSAPPAISTLTHQTTVQFSSGDAVLAGTLTRKPTTGSGHTYLVVTANVDDGAVKSSATVSRTGDAPNPSARSSRRGGVPADRFEQIARGTFDRSDRDGNGVLTGDELNSSAALRDDLARFKEVGFEQYRKVMAARLGVDLAKQTEGSDAAKRDVRRPALDPRYEAYSKKLIERYDDDADGKLNDIERKQMSLDPSAADTDRDGFVSVEELVKWLQRDRG